jgi:hypothetical protein
VPLPSLVLLSTAAEIPATPVNPLTGTGTRDIAVVPLPSSPSALYPQHAAVPPVRTTHEWRPLEIAATPARTPPVLEEAWAPSEATSAPVSARAPPSSAEVRASGGLAFVVPPPFELEQAGTAASDAATAAMRNSFGSKVHLAVCPHEPTP